jgi:hypothetical protein
LLNGSVFLDKNGHLRFYISSQLLVNLSFSGVTLVEQRAHSVVLAERKFVDLCDGLTQNLLICSANMCLITQAVFCNVALLSFSSLKLAQRVMAILDSCSAL